MSRIVFDIETLGAPLESFDETSQKYLTKFAKTEEEVEDVRHNLNLHALTAQVIAIALLNPDSSMGKVLFRSDAKEEFMSEDGLVQFKSGSEKEILEEFWRLITSYNQFITFNGRAFDCPFLMIRSALLGVRPTRNLMPYRYDAQIHCDLLEQLTFYNTTRRFNLDFFCKSFGIESPKDGGITGLDMRELFEAKRFHDIAEYCLGDTKATAELFRRWNSSLNFSEK
ncbi:MAG: ribonuclease H-like domain-containing protein [Bacteroidota bacterium]|nr:ribonuclease H-like domain-containing protein [Bacteroidota bacterium]